MPSVYNYLHFCSAEYEALPAEGGLPVGSQLPEVTLITPMGTPLNLREFLGQPLVLQTGSITCPLYIDSIDAMNEIARRHPSANFVVVYIREAHPGGQIGPHRSADEKRDCARELARSEAEHRRILIDSVDGEFHRQLGSFSNMGFVFNADGRLVFRSDWLQAPDIDNILTGISKGNYAFLGPSAFHPASLKVTWRVLNRAGKGAKRDFFKGVPKIAFGHICAWLAGGRE